MLVVSGYPKHEGKFSASCLLNDVLANASQTGIGSFSGGPRSKAGAYALSFKDAFSNLLLNRRFRAMLPGVNPTSAV